MSDDFDLIAELREDQGKGASRRLRHQGKVPAIIYGAGRPPRALSFRPQQGPEAARERIVLFERPERSRLATRARPRS